MNDMKAASLSSSLLARKGTAAPAGFAPPPFGTSTTMPPPLGASRSAPSPSPPAMADPGPRQSADTGYVGASPKLDRAGRVKTSLRLRPEQHLRLKVVAALRRQSAQKLLVSAMERYLGELAPDMAAEAAACLAETDEDFRRWPPSTRRTSFDLAG